MTLHELSGVYRAHADALRGRIGELKELQRYEDVPGDLSWRIRTLTAMYQEARDLAVLCERYYERGYFRKVGITLGQQGTRCEKVRGQ